MSEASKTEPSVALDMIQHELEDAVIVFRGQMSVASQQDLR